jgi:hypothetical protein
VGARLRGASLLVLVAVALAACSSRDHEVAPAGPQVQIAEGVAPGTGVQWTALLYRTADGLVCTQFRWNGDPNRGDGGCGSGTAPFVTREPGHTTWVIGGSDDPAAVSAVVRFAVARPPVTVDLVEPSPGVTEGIRYYAASIAGGPDVIAIDIVDAAGAVLLSHPIDLPAPAGIPTPS